MVPNEKKSQENFKAVEFMRSERDRLNELFQKDPDAYFAFLETVAKNFKEQLKKKINKRNAA